MSIYCKLKNNKKKKPWQCRNSNQQFPKLAYYITRYQSRPQGIMSDQNFEWRYLENEKSFFKNLKTDFHHFESCFIWEIIIFYAGIPLR